MLPMVPTSQALQSVENNQEFVPRSSKPTAKPCKAENSGKLTPCTPPTDVFVTDDQRPREVSKESTPVKLFRVPEEPFGPKASLAFIPCKRSESTQPSLDDYHIGKEIGRGAFAKVKLAYHRYKRQSYAAKVYDKSSLEDPSRKLGVQTEIDILKMLDHPNVVKLHEVIDTPSHLYLMFEYVNGISLRKYVRQFPNRICPEDQARRIFQGVISAVEYCHSLNVCHRDIKLENVIIDRTNTVKLIDFGFSTCFPKDTKLRLFCGTINYMASEIVQKAEYAGPPADIWACGVLLYALLCGNFPFKAAFDKEVMLRIYKGIFCVPEHLPGAVKDLIVQMMHADPACRPTAGDVLRNEWLGDVGESLELLSTCKFKRVSWDGVYSFEEITEN